MAVNHSVEVSLAVRLTENPVHRRSQIIARVFWSCRVSWRDCGSEVRNLLRLVTTAHTVESNLFRSCPNKLQFCNQKQDLESKSTVGTHPAKCARRSLVSRLHHQSFECNASKTGQEKLKRFL